MKRLNGFSLMEMMIVLTIVAVVAAASAPMINRKVIRSTSEKTPWVVVNGSESIAYNMDSNSGSQDTKTASIGARVAPVGKHPRLYINTSGDANPHIMFGCNNGNLMRLIAGGSSQNVWLSNKSISDDAKTSVALGWDSEANSTNAVAMGRGATASVDDTVAIGRGATASAQGSVAMGEGATANVDDTVAIGRGATASAQSSVAIGAQAQANQPNTIVLGTTNTTVFIPGNFVVGGSSLLGTRDGALFFVKESDKKYHGGQGVGNVYFFKNASRDDKWFHANSPTDTTEAHKQYTDLRAISDRRLKNVGKEFQAGLKEIKKLEVFHYTFKDDKDKTPRVGVMAQDLQKVFPDAVIKGEDGFLRIRMEDIFYAIVNAVKELDSRVSLLEQKQKKIDELEKQVNTLEKRLTALEKAAK